MAIAITDAIHGLGLRPVSPTLVGLRSLFRLEMPGSASGLVRQAVFARRNTAMTMGCIGVLSLFILPILIPIELARAYRIRRHNRVTRRRLETMRLSPVGGYRDNAEAGALPEELQGAESLLTIDWTIWRDGTLCFAGTALGVVRGQEHVVPWVTVYRGAPPKDAIDASALTKAFGTLPVVPARWDWELDDPFEAVERQT